MSRREITRDHRRSITRRFSDHESKHAVVSDAIMFLLLVAVYLGAGQTLQKNKSE